MASVSSFNLLFTCKTISLTPRHHFLASLSPINSIGFTSKKVSNFSKLSIKETKFTNKLFTIKAVGDDDDNKGFVGGGGEVEEGGGATTVVAGEKPPVVKEPTEIDKLKKSLIDSFYGTDRGLRASSDARAEIIELITQLEDKNPTPAPTEALPLLNGKWILAYTSFVGIFPLFARGTLPLVKVEEISQTIVSENLTVQNSVLFSGPLATTSFSTNGNFEIRSPKRVQIKFHEAIIGTPQLKDSKVLPENVKFLGQKIDLSPFKGLITSLQDTASSVISSQPPLKIPITNDRTQSWLFTTYVDEDLRISRGDGGSVFVLIKEGSSLSTS